MKHLMYLLERVLCPTIGCCSVFARWWSWPYSKICNPLAIRNHDRYGVTGKKAKEANG